MMGKSACAGVDGRGERWEEEEGRDGGTEGRMKRWRDKTLPQDARLSPAH